MVQVTMMDSSTRSFPRRFNFMTALQHCCAWWLAMVLCCAAPVVWAQPVGSAVAELPTLEAPVEPAAQGLQLRSTGEVLQLSASLHFELPSLVEDALHKGIPVHFVQEVRLLSERWYWSDKVVAEVQRHMRLSYQPLTRRWRLYTGSSPLSERAQAGVSLGVTFDNLEDALAAMQRITHWNVADVAQLPSSGELTLEFQMRIDTAQLPRPLQMGNLGRAGGSVLVSRSKRIDAREWR